MTTPDVNKVIRAYLVTCGTLTTLIGGATPRIYCPRLPENATLPAISFFTRGGDSNPNVPDVVDPSVQFDCWADNPIDARDVYNKLHDVLEGIQNITVGSSKILSAIQEGHGQDLPDEIPGYFRVLTFFKFKIV